MLTYDGRRAHCEKNFWMEGRWAVVVKCRECGRHSEACLSSVMGLDGKVKLSHCPSCGTLTCVPVLKDHVTPAVIP